MKQPYGGKERPCEVFTGGAKIPKISFGGSTWTSALPRPEEYLILLQVPQGSCKVCPWPHNTGCINITVNTIRSHAEGLGYLRARHSRENVAVDLTVIAHLLSAPSLSIDSTHFLPRSSLTRGQEQDADPNQQIGGSSIEGLSC